jgi:hypothetical protein
MKKTILLTVLAGLSTVSQLKADTDVYLTGSTAFRKNVYAAVQNMFSGTITYKYGSTVQGGDGSSGNGNPVWTMTGTAATIFTNAGTTNISGILTVHGNFTGSVQGIQDLESQSGIFYLDKNGLLSTNIPDVAFSDVYSASTAYPISSSYQEDEVAIQPFTFVKSSSTVAGMTNINNITWEQAKGLAKFGVLPLSAWSHNAADTNTSIYLVNRTKDSGTRRTTFAEVDYGFSQSVSIWVYNAGLPTFWTKYASATTSGSNTNQVIGNPGFANNNYGWGPGWVGGSDVQAQMELTSVSNTCVGYLSFADAQKADANARWAAVVSYNGIWPTAAGSGLTNNTGSSYNDFSPIIYGQYPFWATEVIDYPTTALPANGNLQLSQLGTSTTPGTFLGVLNAQATGSANPTAGSVEYEIWKSEGNAGGSFPNTAIRLSEMHASRANVGGILAP